MHPTIVEISSKAEIVKEELFAPVLYVMKFKVFLSMASNYRDDQWCCFLIFDKTSLV